MTKLKSAFFMLLAVAVCLCSVSTVAAQTLNETDANGNRHAISFNRQDEKGLVVVKNRIELSGKEGLVVNLAATLSESFTMKSFITALEVPAGIQLAGEMEWIAPPGSSLYFYGKTKSTSRPDGTVESSATFFADLEQLEVFSGEKGAREGVVLRLFGRKEVLVEIPLPLAFLRLLGPSSGLLEGRQ